MPGNGDIDDRTSPSVLQCRAVLPRSESRARDPGRHVWTFGKHVRDVTNDEMSAATGLTIEDLK